jgi:hypothetical protein
MQFRLLKLTRNYFLLARRQVEAIIKFRFHPLSTFEGSVNLWWRQTLWRLWKNLGRYGKDNRDFKQIENRMVAQALLDCSKSSYLELGMLSLPVTVFLWGNFFSPILYHFVLLGNSG